MKGLFTILQRYLLVLVLSLGVSLSVHGQDPGRIEHLRQYLSDLSVQVPGLSQRITADLSATSLPGFLKALAKSYNISMDISPQISGQISNHFGNEKVLDVLVFLAANYKLDIRLMGSILSIIPYTDPLAGIPPAAKEIKGDYDPQSQLITLDLNGDSLYSVAKKITQISGSNVVVMPALYGKTVSGYFQSMSVAGALEKLAISNQIKLSTTNDSAYILAPLNADETITTSSNAVYHPNHTIQRSNPSQPGSTASLVESANVNGQQLLSVNVVNTPIKQLVQNLTQQVGVDYFMYSELQGSVTANIKNKPFNEVLHKIFLGTTYTFTVDGGVYLIGDRNLEGLRAERLIKLKYRSVDSLLVNIPEDLKRQVTIREFKELNSFLVSGSEPQIKEIESFVTQLDQKVPMILIEVIMMDISKDQSFSAGIKMGTGDSTTRTGGSLLGGGLDFTIGTKGINNFINKIGLNNVFNLGHVTNNFYIQLQAIEKKDNADVRQTPKLSTLNGHPATLSIGSTRYYSISTQNTVGSLSPNVITTQQYIPVEANLSLKLTPFVSGDENVTLSMDIDITDFTTPPSSTAPPPTSTSKFNSVIRVHNEDMVLLGGIERTEKSESSSGVPFLSRIPVLKWLFSSRSKEDKKVVSIVFIKPTIVY